MDARETLRSDQEQATAAWVSYLNQLRIDRMMDTMRKQFERQDADFESAVSKMSETVRAVNEVIASNDGGQKGIHGNIAEVAEVGVRNARNAVNGRAGEYVRLGDKGPVDLTRGTQSLQMKFHQSNLSLDAIASHHAKYSNFVSDGGKYVIPRDQHETLKLLYGMTEKEASRLTNSGDGPSPRQWRHVQKFFAENDISMGDIESAEFDYDEVQKDTILGSIRKRHSELDSVHGERQRQTRVDAKKDGAPTAREGATVAATSAAIEGGMAFVTAVVAKMRGGKRLRDLDANDWADVVGESGKGMLRGGVRGATVHFATTVNLAEFVAESYSVAGHEAIAKATASYASMSGAMASSLVTAAFGVAEQANRMRRGDIGEAEFLEQSELLCLDATVSAVSSFVGQALIPIPVLGAVIGNTVGCVLCQIAKDGLNKREQDIISSYAEAQRRVDRELDSRYRAVIERLSSGMRDYLSMIDRAIAPDPALAFEGSIELARALGVDDGSLLTTMSDIDNYFLS